MSRRVMLIAAARIDHGRSPRTCTEARRTLLCCAHSVDPARAECEVTLKGGQIGAPGFFCAVKHGGVHPGRRRRVK
jgi:hypothetical protein